MNACKKPFSISLHISADDGILNSSMTLINFLHGLEFLDHDILSPIYILMITLRDFRVDMEIFKRVQLSVISLCRLKNVIFVVHLGLSNLVSSYTTTQAARAYTNCHKDITVGQLIIFIDRSIFGNHGPCGAETVLSG